MVSILAEEVEHSADPYTASAVLDRLIDARPDLADRLAGDAALRAALVVVTAASPHLGRLCVTDPVAVEVLARLDHRPSPAGYLADATGLARWKRLELLRIAARDLLGVAPLEEVGALLADLADDVLAGACTLGGVTSGFAVIGMGKLGARELNYASDIDVMFVGDGDARPVLDVARLAWKVDVGLRPEGRSGALIRSLSSYQAYWDRWAGTWEFQALLKARAVAGDPVLGERFEREAAARVWGRPFGADELRQVRAMKARAEQEVARRGLADRELKRGRGGIRDIEFAIQLLQLVHGRADASLRSPATLEALEALAAGGYVAGPDAAALEDAWRFLRTVEHRLQLSEDQQVHAVPAGTGERTHLARVLGFRDDASTTARAKFERTLHRHQATVRSIHERLFFRPLLEAFTAPTPNGAARGRPRGAGGGHAIGVGGPGLAPDAVADRLAAFGFSDAARTHQAVRELTRGLSRPSHLMQQMLPLILEWLSQAPDPDLGLLGLRALATGQHRRDLLTAVCRESPEAARQLCLLLGTGPSFARGLERHPDLLIEFAEGTALRARRRPELDGQVQRSLAWRDGPTGRQLGLLHLQRGEQLRIAARDLLGRADVRQTGLALTDLAEAVVQGALAAIDPQVPFAVIAMGRFGGGELAYASDLDVLLVYDAGADGGDGARQANSVRAAESAAAGLLRLINGETPATRLYRLDTTLRPEGRVGPLARSLEAYATYHRRWARTWERQALLRGRFVAGDTEVGRRFEKVAREFVWGRPVTDADVREIRRVKARIEAERIPASEDPQFHLKLGRGSLSDIEWTAQLLQLRHGIRATGTDAAIEALAVAGALTTGEARILSDAYRFCEQARNRLFLVRGSPSDSLPSTGPTLTALARSLATTPTNLREEYRRQTRRARQVVERLFYGGNG